ncbi:hypothetical protein Ae201684P_020977 [Aphanomyces euteiches]|nr:hypothetical protein Ae201684P_020977 [Aphanomyces euteiches]
MSAGTGGTIAGVSRFLKEKNAAVQVILADPPGSNSPQCVLRTPAVGAYSIDRLTENFLAAQIDDAYLVSDAEGVEMARHLLREDGIFVGCSSAMNCVAAVRAARKLGPGHTIVTILCDSGQRHLTKFWNDAHLEEMWQLKATASDLSFLDGSTGQP